MRNACKLLIGWVVLLPCFIDTAWGACQGQKYSVYVVPQLDPVTLHKKWAPLLERLGRDSGVCLELFVPSTIPVFEKELRSGRADFAFMNPYHQVMVEKEPGYLPLIRDKKNWLEGVLVVRKNSPIKNISDLQGKTIVFPAPNAYAASLLIRANLERAGVRFVAKYVESHSNAYRGVIYGSADAGGGVNNTLLREPEAMRNNLRVLYTTPASASHPFSAHPRVAQAVRECVTQAFLKLVSDKEGVALLDGIQLPQPIRADFSRDYLPLKKLGLAKLVVE